LSAGAPAARRSQRRPTPLLSIDGTDGRTDRRPIVTQTLLLAGSVSKALLVATLYTVVQKTRTRTKFSNNFNRSAPKVSASEVTTLWRYTNLFIIFFFF